MSKRFFEQSAAGLKSNMSAVQPAWTDPVGQSYYHMNDGIFGATDAINTQVGSSEETYRAVSARYTEQTRDKINDFINMIRTEITQLGD